MLKILNRFLEKYGLYCLAIFVLALNVSLAFDNVVWGDEAFSGNTIYNTSLHGIFEKVYYWDSHPPFYYYWLRLVASIFGYKTYVYHFASLIPFGIGILMAVTVFKKNLGKIPAAFFIVLSGLSAPCAEYNLEIRMYALVFLEILVCAFCAYKLIESTEKKHLWVLLTAFGVMAAYTHYYGLVVGGILLFITVVFDVLRNRKVLRGMSALVAYLVLYMPWVYVFVLQARRVGNNWWLSNIAPLGELTQMIFCGERLKGILAFVSIVFTLIIFIKESEIIYLQLEDDKETITWKFAKPNMKNWSNELYAIISFWLVIILTITFTYVVSVVLNPMTVARYMYPLVPIMLFILMLCIRRILAYGHVKWGNDEYGYVNEEKKEKQIYLFDKKQISGGYLHLRYLRLW